MDEQCHLRRAIELEIIGSDCKIKILVCELLCCDIYIYLVNTGEQLISICILYI